MKLAIIRCLELEDECIGHPCLELIRERGNNFQGIEDIQLVGMVTCGGCSGKGVSLRAKNLLDSGADKVVLTSCITGDSCRSEPCPYFSEMKKSLLSSIGEDKVIFSTL